MPPWKPLTGEELEYWTEFYLNTSNGSLETLAHKCAVLAHRLTKYEGVPDKQQDNSQGETSKKRNR